MLIHIFIFVLFLERKKLTYFFIVMQFVNFIGIFLVNNIEDGNIIYEYLLIFNFLLEFFPQIKVNYNCIIFILFCFNIFEL